MELDAGKRSIFHRRNKIAVMITPRYLRWHHGFDALIELPFKNGIRMREVITFVVKTSKQHTTGSRAYFTPADMWHRLGRQFFHCAWPLPHTLMFPEFFGHIEQVLMSNTNAEHRASTSHALADPTGNAELFHGFLGSAEC